MFVYPEIDQLRMAIENQKKLTILRYWTIFQTCYSILWPQEHCQASSKKFPTPQQPQGSNLKNILTRLLEYILGEVL